MLIIEKRGKTPTRSWIIATQNYVEPFVLQRTLASFRMLPAAEISRRRTFAIISHPDAGKTTLTEKFLLYGNAIHLAGAVTARKTQRATASDWM